MRIKNLSLFFFLMACIASAQVRTIGFDRVVLTDSGRLFGESYRPIVVNYWYASFSSEIAQKLSYRDYILATSSNDNLAIVTDEQRSKLENEIRSNLNYFGITDAEFNRILSMPSKARLAPQPSGRSPLVIVVGGTNGSNAFFTSLAEYLTAQGMIVATLSSFGNNDTTACGYDIDCVQHQVRDLSKVVDHFKQKEWIDDDRISMIAWSFGGLSAWAYAQREKDIQKLVSFDSALGYEYGVNLMKNNRLFDLQNSNVAILHFQSLKSGKKTPQDASFLNALPTHMKSIVRSRKLLHAQFTSLYGVILDYGRGVENTTEWKKVLTKTRDFLIHN
jgi:pimeloyl-ACP methyl ester carboxylesterase